jgi:hypothetical protein
MNWTAQKLINQTNFVGKCVLIFRREGQRLVTLSQRKFFDGYGVRFAFWADVHPTDTEQKASYNLFPEISLINKYHKVRNVEG